MHPVLAHAEITLGCPLHHAGNLALLDKPRRALLFSRGDRRPNPSDPFIRAIIAATKQSSAAGETLVVGANRDPWDLALFTCRNAPASAVIALEDSAAPEEILPSNSLRVWPESQAGLSKEIRRKMRDRLVGLLATNAFSIQVRPGGNMASIAGEMTSRGCAVDPWLCAEIIQINAPLHICETTAAPLSFANRLTHFTREPDDRWPGESRVGYLQWLSSGIHYEPRDSFHALRRILTEKKIRACGRLIRTGEPMVCFTHRDPAELLAENRWRKGLLRWTYSPHAISFQHNDLLPLGTNPVRYATHDFIQNAPPLDQPFLQIANSAEHDWTREEEWRVRGDVNFTNINPERLIALVADENEARELQRDFGVQARAINFNKTTHLH